MSTNIDELKSVDSTSAYTSSEAAEVLRLQQKRIEELETALKTAAPIVKEK